MIYISTGGFRNQTGSHIYNKLKKNGIKNIELSGGKYEKNSNKKIKKFKNVQLHNYFPPPKKSFVLNLSTTNKKIANKSIKFIKRNIKLSKIVGAKYYSFHAGFRIDPKPNQLGKKIKYTKIIGPKIAKDNFLKRVKSLNNFAKKNNIKLLIENNVISKKNLEEFGQNPLLMCDPNEILSFFKKIKSHNLDIGFLLDVAHLKVSAKTLGFNLQKAHKDLREIITAYHLSDNNGLIDSNKKFTNKSWFWKNINNQAKFFTIEVYNLSLNGYKKLIKIVKKKVKYVA